MRPMGSIIARNNGQPPSNHMVHVVTSARVYIYRVRGGARPLPPEILDIPVVALSLLAGATCQVSEVGPVLRAQGEQ